MDSLRLDLIYAARAWRRYPATTFAAILAFALGIGATTTVFSAVSAVLLTPLPYHEPDRLVMLWQDRSAGGGSARKRFGAVSVKGSVAAIQGATIGENGAGAGGEP